MADNSELAPNQRSDEASLQAETSFKLGEACGFAGYQQCSPTQRNCQFARYHMTHEEENSTSLKFPKNTTNNFIPAILVNLRESPSKEPAINILIRSSLDPFLTAMELTENSMNFGMEARTGFVIGGILFFMSFCACIFPLHKIHGIILDSFSEQEGFQVLEDD